MRAKAKAPARDQFDEAAALFEDARPGVPRDFVRTLFGRVPERGDVVIVTPPGANEDYIKRVIGLPGDTIAVRGGRLLINGKLVRYELRPAAMIAVDANAPCGLEFSGFEVASSDGRGLLLQHFKCLQQVGAEDGMVLAHREVADLLHLDELTTLDLLRRPGTVLGGGEVVVVTGQHHHRALIAVDVGQLVAQVVVDGVEVQIALERL